MYIDPVLTTNFDRKLHSGKVRDIYDLDDDKLLMNSTDRISAFDVIMSEAVPGKGIILNNLSKFWFDFFDKTDNHFISSGIDYDFSQKSQFQSLDIKYLIRSCIVKKAQRIDMECVVRGYITGSAWEEYKITGKINSRNIQSNLREGEKFSEPIFTPSTKATEGHDQPLSKSDGENLVGKELYTTLENISIDLFSRAHNHCLTKGILLADTKFEFGYIDGKISLIDEVLTPDSSRFWKIENHTVGKSPEPFDKQFLRNWLNNQEWDKSPPPPKVPDEILENTLNRYINIYQILTEDKIKL